MADVFISYAQEDHDTVVAIANGLEAAGYTTWYFEKDGHLLGVSHQEVSRRAIDDANAMILLASPEACKSPKVHREFMHVQDWNEHDPQKQKLIIPLLCRNTIEDVRAVQPEWLFSLCYSVRGNLKDGVDTVLKDIVTTLKSKSINPSRIERVVRSLEVAAEHSGLQMLREAEQAQGEGDADRAVELAQKALKSITDAHPGLPDLDVMVTSDTIPSLDGLLLLCRLAESASGNETRTFSIADWLLKGRAGIGELERMASSEQTRVEARVALRLNACLASLSPWNELKDASKLVASKASLRLADISDLRGEFDESFRRSTMSLMTAVMDSDPLQLAESLRQLFVVAARKGLSANPLARAAIRGYELALVKNGDSVSQAVSAFGKAFCFRELGDLGLAKESMDRGREICDATPSEETDVLKLDQAASLTGIYLEQGKYGLAWDLAQEGQTECEQKGRKADAEEFKFGLAQIVAQTRSLSDAIVLIRSVGRPQWNTVRRWLDALSLASWLTRAGRYEEAEQSWQECERTSDLLGLPFTVDRLRSRAEVEREVGRLDDAERLLSQAENLARAIADPSRLAWVLAARGDVASARGQYDEAQRCYHEALNQFRSTDSDTGVAQCQMRLVNVLFSQGRYSDAEERRLKAESIFEQRGNLLELLSAKGMKAAILLEKGNVSEAEGIYRGLEEKFKDYDIVLAQVRTGEAGIASKQGRIQESISLLGEALKALQNAGVLGDVLDTLTRLANTYVSAGDFNHSLQLVDRIERESEEHGWASYARQARLLRTDVHRGLGESQKAIAVLEAMMQEEQRAGQNTWFIETRLRLAGVLVELERHAEAEMLLQRVAADTASIGDTADRLLAAFSLSQVMIRTERHDKAEEILIGIAADSKKIGHVTYQISAAQSLSQVVATTKRPEEARKYLEEAHSLAQSAGNVEQDIGILCDLGSFLLGRQKNEAAKQNFDAALDLAEKTGIDRTHVLTSVGNVYLGNQEPQLALAKEYAVSAIRTAEQSRNEGAAAEAHQLLGRVHLAEGHFGKAKNELAEAVKAYLRLGNNSAYAASLYYLAKALLGAGEKTLGLRVLARASDLLESHGDSATLALLYRDAADVTWGWNNFAGMRLSLALSRDACASEKQTPSRTYYLTDLAGRLRVCVATNMVSHVQVSEWYRDCIRKVQLTKGARLGFSIPSATLDDWHLALIPLLQSASVTLVRRVLLQAGVFQRPLEIPSFLLHHRGFDLCSLLKDAYEKLESQTVDVTSQESLVADTLGFVTLSLNSNPDSAALVKARGYYAAGEKSREESRRSTPPLLAYSFAWAVLLDGHGLRDEACSELEAELRTFYSTANPIEHYEAIASAAHSYLWESHFSKRHFLEASRHRVKCMELSGKKVSSWARLAVWRRFPKNRVHELLQVMKDETISQMVSQMEVRND